MANRKSGVDRGQPRPTHYDLEVWKEAMRLASDTYRACQLFPDGERYVLGRELWRSALSVPSNIAEGAARGSKPELIRFLLIARGSLLEFDSQLWLAFELGFVADRLPWTSRIASLLAKLNALITAERRRAARRASTTIRD
jgi:four helix bundle protein